MIQTRFKPGKTVFQIQLNPGLKLITRRIWNRSILNASNLKIDYNLLFILLIIYCFRHFHWTNYTVWYSPNTRLVGNNEWNVFEVISIKVASIHPETSDSPFRFPAPLSPCQIRTFTLDRVMNIPKRTDCPDVLIRSLLKWSLYLILLDFRF